MSVWLGWKQRVKGRDAFHVYHGHLQQICDRLADRIIDIGKLTHGQVQRRQQHSTPSRVAFEKPSDCRLAFLENCTAIPDHTLSLSDRFPQRSC